MGDYVKYLEHGEVYTAKMDGQYLCLERFNPSRWRQSVIVSERQWTLLRNNFQVLRDKEIPGFYEASVSLPWDIPEQDFTRLEAQYGGDAQRDLRRHFYQDKPFQYSKLNQKYKVGGVERTMREFIKQQREFDIEADPEVHYVIIRRSPRFHPVTTFPFLKDWQIDMESWRQEGWSAFRHIDKALGLLVSRDLG